MQGTACSCGGVVLAYLGVQQGATAVAWVDGSICLDATPYDSSCLTLNFPTKTTYNTCKPQVTIQNEGASTTPILLADCKST